MPANPADMHSFDPKNMIFKRLGPSGLRVSVFAYGGWLTLGGTQQGEKVTELVSTAFEHGINTFDTAEVYSGGRAEIELGNAVKQLNIKRSELVIITKVFFGTGSKEPNGRGLSRKHIIEGCTDSLHRLQMNYVDVLMCHRPDSTSPMEEIVRAMSFLIDTGKVFYWGTSEWSAQQITEAIVSADRLGLHRPIADQPQYNLLHRDRCEKEYAPLTKNYGYGQTVWSPLSSGLLTNKYAQEIPKGSRYDNHKDFFSDTIKELQTESGKAKIAKVTELAKVAERLGGSATQLALAWCAKADHVSTVLLGATKPEQLVENLGALDMMPKLTPEILDEIDKIMDNKPSANPTYGR
ncbi:uncharacterized protein L969DRAFT_74776 [Mixia osmundae IAM 14324]|uniref:NADP-dependent oxidoreductase domain-containing protein n=1 Tax=Mixia osmundae (strain CBS 9802 / IAM 14324 / JCM 22182 / KY 12970) TaxID=764103 RepID=G7DVL6_MIXOS|nr:uncharacterized protein L969DRAFT_74776 [Mixia osmundae IAM 14324]KEI39530.1 hypothetical protein L969DRAFT_74776 [Mixia osmundae IAM 14324]GAA94626.1 hypothetical protein E5Q_01278 [Mixia osmundae IAM 14324]